MQKARFNPAFYFISKDLSLIFFLAKSVSCKS